MTQRAVFLDRDNTIIADPGYLKDPDAVQLLPGAADAIRRLNESGYLVVVATNQSGVARGRVTEKQLAEIHQRLRTMLLEQGARLDAIYHCPYLPGAEATVARFRKNSPLRKPQPGMLLRAADELEIALAGSWMIGDSGRDILAGRRAGCRTVLVGGAQADTDDDGCLPDYTVKTLAEAVDVVLTKREVQDEPAAAPDGDELPSPANPATATDPSTANASPEPSALADTLNDLGNVLRRIERRERQDDFSVARLVATLAQMLALAAGGWGVAQIIAGKPAEAWLLLAILLQLTVLATLAFARH